MDIINLGSEGRKSRIKPREGVRRDKYNMEDVDEFFAEDDEEEDGEDDYDDNGSKSRTTNRAASKSIRGQGARGRDFNNVARKIDFTEAEAESFTLSPISFQTGGTKSIPQKKKSKKSPLRSPLQERQRVLASAEDEDQLARESDNEILEHDHEEDDDLYNNNFDNDDDFEDYDVEKASKLSPISFESIDKTHSASTTSHYPAKSFAPSPKASSLTKSMALGNSSRRKRAPVIRDDVDNSQPITSKAVTTSGAKGAHTVKPSPLPSPPPDGLRRSKRTKIAPLAFWRNERIVYTRANEEGDDADTTLANDIKMIPLQEIKEVVHIPDPNAGYSASTTKRRPSRSKSKQPNSSKTNSGGSGSGSGAGSRNSSDPNRSYDYESDPEIEGSEWYKDKSLFLPVYTDETLEDKSDRRIAWAPSAGDFKTPPKDPNSAGVVENFRVATLFDEDKAFTATGLLELPFEGIKSLRHTAEHVFIFHVIKGLIEVTVNDRTFVVTRGCSFEVPRGNAYGLKNLGRSTANLFFVQTKVFLQAEGGYEESDQSWN